MPGAGSPRRTLSLHHNRRLFIHQGPSRQNPFQFPIYLLCFTFSFFILLLYYLFIYLFHCIMVTLPSLFHLSIYLLYIHRTTYLLLSVVTPHPTESEYYLYFLLYLLLTFIILVILFTTGLYRNTVVTPHPTEIILFTTGYGPRPRLK